MEVIGNIVVCDSFTVLKKSINAIYVSVEDVVFERVANSYKMDFSNYNGLRLFNTYGDRMPDIPDLVKHIMVEFYIKFKLTFYIDGNPNGFTQVINVDYESTPNLTVEYISLNNDMFRVLLKESTHKFLLEMNKKIFTSEDLSLN